MKILKTTDRVSVKIEDVTLIIAPMSYAKKIEFSGLTKVIDGVEMNDIGAMLGFTVQHCLKGWAGVVDHDGKPVELTFKEDGTLSDDSMGDAMLVVTKLKANYIYLFNLAGNNVPKEIHDSATGKKLKGVEVTINPKI
jgi:hypothetical protein